MPGLIGYYVHHQGEGHRQRAMTIALQAPDRFVLLGSGLGSKMDGLRHVALDDDRPVPGSVPLSAGVGDCLHYTPMHHAGIQQRVAATADWIARHRPALIVVDVSVEIAMLARLAAVPVVYVRLSGARNDSAHWQAFRAADRLLAPFHRDLDDPSTPDWVREKTWYVPGLTRSSAGPAVDPERVLVVSGAGGGQWDVSALEAAAEALPHLTWRVIGQPGTVGRLPANLSFHGWIDDADAQIASAGIVLGHAGDGVVNSVLAAGRPFICLPQQRPYDEQFSKARQLAALGAAVVLEHLPAASEWQRVIDDARALDPRVLRRLHDSEGSQRAIDLLLAAAGRSG